jgi:N-acetylneuraminic acid mutarotase
MKNIAVTIAFLLPVICFGQNVGIDVPNPQQKLHVGGGIRADALSGSNGVLKFNASGDLVGLPNSGNVNDALLGNGTWGAVSGTVPAGTIVATESYNDPALLSKGFTLFGTIAGYSRFINYPSFTALAGDWAVTYYRGNLSKLSPPLFDGNNLAVWADTVLYVFSENQLYAYNPVTDTWRFVFLNPTSFIAAAQAKAVWTGTEILVWGGYFNSATNNGFRYNPGTNLWTAIPETNQPSARYGFAMQLVDNQVVVWGGTAVFGGSVLNNGAVLNLATNTWTAISNTGAPSARTGFTSVVNTSQKTMIIWGGRGAIMENTGAVYDPVTNSWSAVTTTGAPVARDFHTAVWSGTEMIVFGGRDVSGNPFNSGGRYNPVANTWTATSTTGAPARAVISSAWTDTRMLVSGGTTGNSNGPDYWDNAYLYNPVSNSWSAAGDMGVAKGSHLSIRAGNIIIVIGGVTSIYNTASGAYTNVLGYPQGSRYFLTNTVTSKTEIQNRSDLFLYIKQ